MNSSRPQSEILYKEALEHIVGGVNSPSRSFKAVGGGAPVFMKRRKAHTSGMLTTTATSIIWQRMALLSPDTLILILHKPLVKQQQTVCCTVRQPSLKSSLPKC